MTHLYSQPITVTCVDDLPSGFLWQKQLYTVAEILATWRLTDYWWDPQRASDRTYYRLQCIEGLLCEVYSDAVIGKWVLERIWD